MDEKRLLSGIWNWLPAFKAVAETEHLPTASKRSNLTSSALSRSIRQLEDALGHELFNRVGRSLVLNSQGTRLLFAMNEATQGLGSALWSITSEPMKGPLRISSLGVLTNDYVIPAVLYLKRAHPDLEPVLLNNGQREANELLVRGHLDVAFYYDALTHEDLLIQRLGECTASVYCGVGHPLYGEFDAELEQLLEHPFAVAVTGDRGRTIDGWPIDIPRKVGMRMTLLTSAVAVTQSGLLLSVLPDVVALPLLRSKALHRFSLQLIPPFEMYATTHRKEGSNPNVHAMIEAVQARVEAVDRDLAALE